MNRRRLYRSADDRMIAGVAAGVAEYFDIDPSIVRIVWAVAILLSAGFMLLVYIVMAVVVPLEPDEWGPAESWAPGGAPVGYAASDTPAPGQADAASGEPASSGEGVPTGAGGTTPEGAGTGTEPAGEEAAAGAPAPSSTGSSEWTTAGGGWSGGPGDAGDWRSQRREERWQRRQERWQRRQERWESGRPGSGALVFGLLLILVGGVLAAKQLVPNLDEALVWPIAVIVFGAILVVSAFFGRGEG